MISLHDQTIFKWLNKWSQNQGEWKIYLTMAINFISSTDSTRTMHPKSNNIEIMTGNEIDEITEELFETLLQRYQWIRRINERKWIYFW